MIKEAIGTGPSVDAAIDDGCRQLGMSRDDVKTEILNLPVKKTLGLFGGAPARVRIYVEETPLTIAQNYLTGIFEQMGVIEPDLKVEETENGAVFTISGDDIGFLIGRRGETLDALQYLAGLVANRNTESYYRITINYGNYREKREQTLTALARRMAMQAVKTGRSVSLEPMNPYERRIIHTAVQGIRGATSWSEGDESARHVIIGPEKGAAAPKREGNGGQNRPPRRDGYRGKPRGKRPPARRDGEYRVAGAPVDKEIVVPQNEKPEVPLYGKIEPKK